MTEEKIFSTEKGDIHYFISRADGAQALVFLPGLTADHRLFNKQLEEFEGEYTCLVWDAPGHYLSRPFDLDISLQDKARWLREILRQEGIEKPVLIGQSMGGYVSQCFMELYPDLAAGFISIDSAPLQKKYMTRAEIWLMYNVEPVYRMYPWKQLIKQGSRGVGVTPYAQENMAQMMSSYTKDEYCALAGSGYQMLADAIEADLPYRIPCPALLLCGEKDMAGSSRGYNRRWAKTEGLPLTVIPDAGHNSNADRPETVNRIIREFADKVK